MGHAKRALNGLFHQLAHRMETIPKVRGHRCWMPAKFEGDLIILGAPILETNGSSHPIRVGNNLLNVLPH
eukprot:scaffold11831_cov228-Cylindrotheca_fusiformis.AAC.1